MQSPKPVPRTLLAVLIGAASLATPMIARGDDKQVCRTAYDKTQAMRRDGHLQAARQQAALCTRDVCAAFVRTDCATWIGAIDASQPTVVFEVLDASGQETTQVHIKLDGEPWIDALDGKAKLIDPGQHTLSYALQGRPSIDATLQIHEGEKNRKVTVSFAGPTPSPSAPPSAEHALATPDAAPRSVTPWIIGGVGVAGLAIGGIFAGLTLHQKSIANAHCDDAKPSCDSTGESASSTGRALGAVSTVGFIVGGLGVGASAVWLILRAPAKSDAPATALGMGPSVTANSAGWRLEGSF